MAARRLSLAFVATITLVAAVPTSSSGGSAALASVVVRTSRYGPILFDGRGYVLYAFTSDRRGRATCYGTCARRWPPFVVRSRPVARKGANASLVGATRRRDGRLQAAYAGRPLYHYVGDTAPRVILCQGASEFGGLWLVLRSTGKLAR